MSEASVRGLTVVVTGGSRGIGLACAEELLRGGGRVVICARGERSLQEAATRLRSIPGAALQAVAADVTSAVDVERVLDAAYDLGGLDGLVHCAAVLGPIGPVVGVEPDSWWEAVRVNLFGTFLIARAACRRMLARGTHGSVVLLSGGGAATPFPRYTAYACGKVGVVRFTETLALEMAEHGVRVNCLAPGFVATRLHEQTVAAGAAAAGSNWETTVARLKDGAVPASVAARTAAFLLSPGSQGITGRFVAAPYDGWQHWPERLEQIRDSDLFTLRRIVPRDRGMDWQ